MSWGGAPNYSQEGLKPGITLNRLAEDECEFTLHGVDGSVANAMRRVLLAEVPSLAIDLVNIYENSSVLHDEFIAHRLGLVPLRFKGGGPGDGGGAPTQSITDLFAFPWECDCEAAAPGDGGGGGGGCSRCSVVITLRVDNPDPDPDGEPVSVTSQDLVVDVSPWLAAAEGDAERAAALCPVEVAHFSHEADRVRAPNDVGVVIVKLGPGQALVAECVARLGTGKLHAKYNATSTVCMRGVPRIALDRDLLAGVPGKEKRAFVKACTAGVLAYDEASDQVLVEAPEKATNVDEIGRLGAALARRHGLPANPVHADFAPATFVFTVETTGALSPYAIVEAAFAALIKKLRLLQEALQTAEGGAGLGAAGT